MTARTDFLNDSKAAKPPKTKKIVARKPKDEIAFGGLPNLMSPSIVGDLKQKKLWRTLSIAAKAWNVPPQGVTVLADMPYMNKVGLHYKLAKYSPEPQRLELTWIHYATPNEPYAIVEARLFVGDKMVSQSVGEATEKNVKLEAVKSMLNMMAETRAKNRAIWTFITAQLFDEMSTNLNKMVKQNEATPEDATVVQQGTSTTAEEMDQPQLTSGHRDNGLTLVLSEVEKASKQALIVLKARFETTKEFNDEEKKLIFKAIDKRQEELKK